MAIVPTLNILLNLGGRDDETSAAILFAVDISGSMMGEPIKQVRSALRRLVHLRRASDFVAVMTFCDDTDRVADFSQYPEYVAERIAHIEAKDAATRLLDSIRAGLEWLGEQKASLKLAVLLSDGEDCGSTQATEDQCIELANSLGIYLYTIGYTAEGPASDGMQLMRRVAEKTRGRFFYAPAADQLQKVFLDAFREIQTEHNSDLRGRVRAELGEIDQTSRVWGRFISINACEKNDERRAPSDSPVEHDNPFLYLQTAAASRREMHACFAEKFLREHGGTSLLYDRVRDVLLRQGEMSAGMFDLGVNVFVVGRVNDLLTLSSALEVARQVREVRRKNPDLFKQVLRVVGLFCLHGEARWTVEQQRNIYAWLEDLRRAQSASAAQVFDSVVFISSNNSHPSNNPRGFVNLHESRNNDMIVETLAALNASPGLVATAAQNSKPRGESRDSYFSVGELSLFVNQKHMLENSGNAYGAALLEQVYLLEADTARARRRAQEFFQSQPIDFQSLKTGLLRVTGEQDDALQKLKFDLDTFWPFVGEKRSRYRDRQHYLSHLPYDLREHAEFILTEKLSRFKKIVENNTAGIISELASAIERYTDGELRGSPSSHPLQAEQWLAALHARVKQELDEFRAGGGAQDLGTAYFSFSFGDLKIEEDAPDIEQAYTDLTDQIQRMPQPEAIFARFSFLGLISAYAIDRLVSLTPAFILNIGPLRLPMVLGLLTFILFVLAGFWKYSLGERRLSYFITYYAKALQKKARDRAILLLRSSVLRVYEEVIEKIGAGTERSAPLSELEKLEKLRSYLSDLLSDTLKRGVRQEEESFFHVAVLGAISDEEGNPTLKVLEREPAVGYPPSSPLVWKKEAQEFLADERGLLAHWRSIADVRAAGELEEWERVNEDRLRFKDSFRRFACERFAEEVRRRAHLHALFRDNTRRHNERIYRRIVNLCYSPMYSTNANPTIWRYWSADADNYHSLSDAAIFPELGEITYEPSGDPSHLRLFTMMRFDAEDIAFFCRCKTAYDALPDKSSLHPEREEELPAVVAEETEL
jgi:von Willebrand factor type A domain-containing protein